MVIGFIWLIRHLASDVSSIEDSSVNLKRKSNKWNFYPNSSINFLIKKHLFVINEWDVSINFHDF